MKYFTLFFNTFSIIQEKSAFEQVLAAFVTKLFPSVSGG